MADGDNIAFLPQGLLSPSALRKPEPEQPAMPEGIDIQLDTANDNRVRMENGALIIDEDDGAVIIDFNPASARDPERKGHFDENLAEIIDSGELANICENTLRGIQFDENSRREWLETRAQGIRILALKIEGSRSSIDATTALEGMSNVRHPMLLEATLRFQANARGELLPSDGPVKVSNSISESEENDLQSEKLERDFNYYLTSIATEYYPDTDRMLLYVGFGGCGFKKVYNCPLRQRPVSESIDAKDLIVSNAATDMANSGRVTHLIQMRPNVLKRMQLAKAYRDVPIQTPSGVIPNPVDRQIADTQGIDPTTIQQEDRDHTIYECYTELNIQGLEDKKRGVPTGLALPYRVVIEKDSRQVLEIRRNWKEGDETKTAKLPFVKYPFVPGLGFYDIGLIHILGNTTNALTAAWRELLDAGMFANFPGFLYVKPIGRQNTNEFRVPPGGGAPVQIDGMDDINKAIMPLPYKDISVAFAQFVDKIAETGARVGGTAEVQVAEGRQDAPVGTTLALIEQATKVEGAVHKRLHAAQAQEFQLLKECFRENPESFINAMKKRGETDWDEQTFLAALENSAIVPMADPNTPSHMHRLMKAMALIQLDKAYPGQMDPRKLLKRVADMIKVDDFDALLAPPQGAPGIPPEVQLKMAEIAQKAKELEAKPQIMAQQLAADREQWQHEDQMQQRESQDQSAERQQDLAVSNMGFREAMMNNQTQLHTERMKFGAAVIEAKADIRGHEADERGHESAEKVAEQGVKVAEHSVKEAQHKATGDAAKAKAAAKKPTVKPKAKK